MQPAIAQAADMGYIFFDTAECYPGNRADGMLVHNEDLVGATLYSQDVGNHIFFQPV